MSLSSGPESKKQPPVSLKNAVEETVSVNELKEKSPVVYQILQKLAIGNFNKEDKTFAKALAKNLVDELSDAEDPAELESIIAYIIMQRLFYTANNTLVLRNNDLFPRILMQEFLVNIKFVINFADEKEITALREKILTIAEGGEKRAQLIQELKALFNQAFANEQLIATLLPFYQSYINGSKTVEESAAKRKAFIGQFSFPFVESFLAKSLDDDDAFLKLSKTLRALREDATNGLYDDLIKNLDKALPDFDPAPRLSQNTLKTVENLYNACADYLKIIKETQTTIAAWVDYANRFEMHSPVRRAISELVEALQIELDESNKSFVNVYRNHDGIKKWATLLKETVNDLTETYDALKEDLDLYLKRSKDLEETFTILASDFPKKSPEYNALFQIAADIRVERAALETDIGKIDFNEEYDNSLIDQANETLTELLKSEINKSTKDKTPAQRMADLMRKAKTPEEKAKREELLGHLVDEGADPNATTHNYRGRAASSAVRDFFSNITLLRNPLLPRSRSASDIAWMNGASPRTLEKLTPRSAGNSPRDRTPIDHPKAQPRKGWDRVNPKHLISDVSFYLGLHRIVDMVRKSYEGLLSFNKGQSNPVLLAPPPNSDDSRIPAILAASGYTAGFDAQRARTSASQTPARLQTGHDVRNSGEGDLIPQSSRPGLTA